MDAGARRARTALRALWDDTARDTLLQTLHHPRGAHDRSGGTRFDRYPHTFAAVRAQLEGRTGLRLLSFGCSTGQEVHTLRRYFPDATIVGVDVYRHRLRVARKANRDPKIHFAAQASGKFDAIFCMAVFRGLKAHGHPVIDPRPVYPIERFEQALFEVDRLLVPQGLLVIAQADYELTDSALDSRYAEVLAALDGSSEVSAISRKLRDANPPDAPLPPTWLDLLEDSDLRRAARGLEAAALLSAATLAVRTLPFRTIARALGEPNKESPRGALPIDQAARASRIGATVEAAARRMPFEAVCLPQAIAAKLMLDRRRIPSTIYFGVRRRGEAIDSHAWLRAGDDILTGWHKPGTHAPIDWFS